MTTTQWVVLGILIGYVLVASFAIWGVGALMRSYAGRWQRRAAMSLIAATLFTPGIYAGNNGGWIPVPMWMSIGQMTSGDALPSEIWTNGFAPVAVIFAVLFAISSIVTWVRSYLGRTS